ncbi:MAG: polysaccharide deacetylase family protein [Methanomassiliicoccaceae archaeon]|nr:polysaccharide deacetylase family protein [Methanomassiliicoccaceae archaeon]
MTKRFCFSVDVDRDVNECVPGRSQAISRPNGKEEIRFASSEKGANAIMKMLNETGIKATFFAEARTLDDIDTNFGKNEVAMHGLDHEDMTGEESGIKLSDEQLEEIFLSSVNIIRDKVGRTPKGFRAPYMRTDERIMNLLSKFGASYDSSLYAKIGTQPYGTGIGIKEIPVPESTDINGKRITGYLWPMHEGTRTFNDFIEMADRTGDGVFVIATHSWHIAETISGGILPNAKMKKNIDNVRKIITSLLDKGFEAVTMEQIAERK